MACVVKREPFLLVIPPICTYLSPIYIKKLTTLLLSQAVVQSDKKKVSLEKDGGLFKSYHCFQFLLDFLCSFTSPSGCICQEIADDAIC